MSYEKLNFSMIADQNRFTKLSNEDRDGVVEESHAEAMEANKEAKYLEASKKVGEYYINLVGAFTGKGEPTSLNIDDIDHPIKTKIRTIGQRAKDGFEQQHLRAQLNNLDARKLLEQVRAFSTPEISAQLNDISKYRSKELSPGMFAVYIEPQLYSSMRAGSSALAVKFKPGEGVSFIILPDYGDSKFNKIHLEENLPHETHHILWNFSKGEAVLSDESNKDIADAFIMYQDEVMARLSSNGHLSGYTHLQMLDPETRQKFAEEYPDIVKTITETMVAMNELLQEIDDVRKQTNIDKKDLILAVMDATNFGQLKQNLLQMKSIIEKQPKTKTIPESSSSWDFV